MRMERIKSESELPDLGVKIQLQILDDNIEAVIIGEGDNQIRITRSSEYSPTLKVSRPQQKKSKEVWVVTGKLLGLTDYRSEEFEHEYEAQGLLHRYEAEHGSSVGLEVKEETVWYYEDKI